MRGTSQEFGDGVRIGRFQRQQDGGDRTRPTVTQHGGDGHDQTMVGGDGDGDDDVIDEGAVRRFALGRNDNYIFLEVNPQGRWLWGDDLDWGLYHLEAMAEFLILGSPTFRNLRTKKVSYGDYLRSSRPTADANETASHFGHLITFCYRQEIFPVNTATRVTSDPRSDPEGTAHR